MRTTELRKVDQELLDFIDARLDEGPASDHYEFVRIAIEPHRRNTVEYPPRFDEFDESMVVVCGGCRAHRSSHWNAPGCPMLRATARLWAAHPEFQAEWSKK